MQRTDKDAVTRNLNDTFQLARNDYEVEIPPTPAEALLAAKKYLHCAQIDEQAEAHRNTSRALKLMREALAKSTSKKALARRRTRRSSPGGEASSLDDDDDDYYRCNRGRDDRDKDCGHDDREKDRRHDDR